MNKVKKRMYNFICNYSFRIYTWSDKKFWDAAGDKKRNTERMIANADKYDLESWAKDIREQEQESMEALARFSEMQMKMDEKNRP
jgi:hypothetical protein